MKTVTDFLVKSQVQYFSTIGIDNRPKVRPFMFMLEDSGRLYFCTGTQKKVYQEMQANPYVELCACGENHSWMRLSGRATFSDDRGIKAKILEGNGLVKSIYQTPDNPAFAVFYLEEAEATIADFSGAATKLIRL